MFNYSEPHLTRCCLLEDDLGCQFRADSPNTKQSCMSRVFDSIIRTRLLGMYVTHGGEI